MTEFLPDWTEDKAAYEGQPNNNFGISFKKDDFKIQFIKDRSLLEISIFEKDESVKLNDLFSRIIEFIPDQDSQWRLAICVELIDYYMEFLRKRYSK